MTPSVTASLLTGPAEIVAAGELSASWLADLSPVGLGTAERGSGAGRARAVTCAGRGWATQLEPEVDERPAGPHPQCLLAGAAPPDMRRVLRRGRAARPSAELAKCFEAVVRFI